MEQPPAPDNEWRKRAHCLGLSADIFHPGKGENATSAKAICAVCPVIDECREDAIADPQQLGIAGGTSMRERRMIARRRGLDYRRRKGPGLGPIDHGTERGYQAHKRRAEPACDMCIYANRVTHAASRAKARSLKAAS